MYKYVCGHREWYTHSLRNIVFVMDECQCNAYMIYIPIIAERFGCVLSLIDQLMIECTSMYVDIGIGILTR